DLPDSLRLLAFFVFFEPFHIGRGRRWRRSHDVFKHECTTKDRSGAIRIRGDHEDAALAEQSKAVRIIQRYTTEPFAPYVRNAVMQSQPLIEERVVRCEQIDGAAVFANHAVHEQFHLTLEGFAEVVVEVRELD